MLGDLIGMAVDAKAEDATAGEDAGDDTPILIKMMGAPRRGVVRAGHMPAAARRPELLEDVWVANVYGYLGIRALGRCGSMGWRQCPGKPRISSFWRSERLSGRHEADERR